MSRVALVTGANQGLGLALVQDLANRLAHRMSFISRPVLKRAAKPRD